MEREIIFSFYEIIIFSLCYNKRLQLHEAYSCVSIASKILEGDLDDPGRMIPDITEVFLLMSKLL